MKWILIFATLSVSLLFLWNRSPSYSRQNAHDAAVEKIGAIASSLSNSGVLPPDLEKVLGVENLPKVSLPHPVNLDSPERFEVVLVDWGGVISEKEGEWSALTQGGRRIESSQLPTSVRQKVEESMEASKANDQEFFARNLLSSMRTAKNEQKVLVILSPRLDPALKIIAEASRSGGRGEFIGVNVVIASDKEDDARARSAFGETGAIVHSTSPK